jgi:hypothetical protein
MMLKRAMEFLYAFIFVLIAYGTYTGLNNQGWIPHNHETSVFVPADSWMIGELRTCEMQIMFSQSLRDYFLDCAAGSGKPHMLPVKYWGRLDREGHFDRTTGFRFLHWRCQRLESSLTCWAVD